MQILILGTLAIPGYEHPKRYHQLAENFDVYQDAKNKQSFSFLEISHFKEDYILIGQQHFARTRILQDIGFVVKYQ